MNTVATEAGHWYDQEGNPVHEVVAKNGMLRPTTLADARKLNLSPSVSGIIKVAASWPLENYRTNQLLTAAATVTRDPLEGDQGWMDRVLARSKKHSETARDLGTIIHGCIEKFLCGEDFDDLYSGHVAGAADALHKWCGLNDILPEKSFAHPLGYGGKCDVHKLGFVADFKSKDFTELNLPGVYESHAMQLAAYREGFNMLSARCAVIYVSTSVPGFTHLVELDQGELDRGWDMFDCLLRYWQLKNKYVPRTELTIAEEEMFA